MKTVKKIIWGVVLVELALAIYAVPLANFTLLFIVGVGGLVLIALLKLMGAQVADRRHEREAWKEVALAQNHTIQHQTTQFTKALTAANAQQAALVQGFLDMGAILTMRNGIPYATLPDGIGFNLSHIEAECWREIAPDKVAGQLPAGNGKGGH